ncbi:MAG: energy transducer TonB [Muribaculaceae bacterium]|nr:energy transducer TonB [Muribaculaceae bacterium]
MAKNIDLTSKQWCDIVFDGKNKDFGAYVLRQTSKNRHLRAFIYTLIGVVIVALLAWSYLSIAQFIAERSIADENEQELIGLVNQEDTQEEEEEQQRVEEQKPEVLPEEVLNTVKQTQILIDKDENVKKDDEVLERDKQIEDDRARGTVDFDKGTDDIGKVDQTKKDVAVVEEKKEEPKVEKVYTTADVEQMPQFPGGDAALYSFIQSHLNYPAMAIENGVQGRVTVRFKVDKHGKVSNVSVARGKDPDLDKEAVRVVKMLPDFIPAKMNGQSVAVWYNLPVNFKLK